MMEVGAVQTEADEAAAPTSSGTPAGAGQREAEASQTTGAGVPSSPPAAKLAGHQLPSARNSLPLPCVPS